VSQSNETWLDNPWASAAPYCKRELSNLSLGSGSVHERTVAPFALAFALWNPRSCWLHCLAGWLVATKEEKLKLHSCLVGVKFYLTLATQAERAPWRARWADKQKKALVILVIVIR
jgi:hypothetical protein